MIHLETVYTVMTAIMQMQLGLAVFFRIQIVCTPLIHLDQLAQYAMNSIQNQALLVIVNPFLFNLLSLLKLIWEYIFW